MASGTHTAGGVATMVTDKQESLQYLTVDSTTFLHWRTLARAHSLHNDSDMAAFLLQHYEKTCNLQLTQCVKCSGAVVQYCVPCNIYMTQSSSPSSLLPSDAVSEDQGERTEVVTVGDDDDGAAIASGVSQTSEKGDSPGKGKATPSNQLDALVEACAMQGAISTEGPLTPTQPLTSRRQAASTVGRSPDWTAPLPPLKHKGSTTASEVQAVVTQCSVDAEGSTPLLAQLHTHGTPSQQETTTTELPGTPSQQETATTELPGTPSQQGTATTELPGTLSQQGTTATELPGTSSKQLTDTTELPGTQPSELQQATVTQCSAEAAQRGVHPMGDVLTAGEQEEDRIPPITACVTSAGQRRDGGGSADSQGVGGVFCLHTLPKTRALSDEESEYHCEPLFKAKDKTDITAVRELPPTEDKGEKQMTCSTAEHHTHSHSESSADGDMKGQTVTAQGPSTHTPHLTAGTGDSRTSDTPGSNTRYAGTRRPPRSVAGDRCTGAGGTGMRTRFMASRRPSVLTPSSGRHTPKAKIRGRPPKRSVNVSNHTDTEKEDAGSHDHGDLENKVIVIMSDDPEACTAPIKGKQDKQSRPSKRKVEGGEVNENWPPPPPPPQAGAVGSLESQISVITDLGDPAREDGEVPAKRMRKARTEKEAKVYPCDVCGEELSSRSQRKVHIHKHHGSRPFACKQCGATYTIRSHLRMHELRHAEVKPHACPHCPKTLASPYALKCHLTTHSTERPVACHVCGQRLKSAKYLREHMRTHDSNDKPFICQLCGMRFSRKNNLNNHIRIHNNDKRFVCPHCNRRFIQSGSLKSHVHRKHNPHRARPFVCEICGEARYAKDQFEKHMMIHTGTKPFKCQVCGAAFVQSNALKGHMKIHTELEGKSHWCSLCGAAFKKFASLKKHLHKVHQDCGDMSIATYEIIEVQVEEGTGEALINLPPDVKVSDVQMVSSVPDLHFEDGPKPLDFQLQVKQADLL